VLTCFSVLNFAKLQAVIVGEAAIVVLVLVMHAADLNLD
jgi:hypothetical protein